MWCQEPAQGAREKARGAAVAGTCCPDHEPSLVALYLELLGDQTLSFFQVFPGSSIRDAQGDWSESYL